MCVGLSILASIQLKFHDEGKQYRKKPNAKPNLFECWGTHTHAMTAQMNRIWYEKKDAPHPFLYSKIVLFYVQIVHEMVW